VRRARGRCTSFCEDSTGAPLKTLGPVALSLRFDATPELIEIWASGHATMPDRKVLMLIDVLDEIDRLNDPRN